MYVKLKAMSDQHEFLGGRALTSSSSFDIDASTLLNAPKESMSSMKDTKELRQFAFKALNKHLKNLVTSLARNELVSFEGVVIDNGAARFPSGISALLRYCASTRIFPLLKLRKRCLKGMIKGRTTSLGCACIRIPLRNVLILEFDADILDHDSLLIFGAERHINLKCSSNEQDLKSTHHLSGTVVPLNFVKSLKMR